MELNKRKEKSLLVSAVVIAKNEEKYIGECLRSLGWVGEIILVDSGSVDSTPLIGERFKAKVINYPLGGFSEWRNRGLKEARNPWVFYVDADERVTSELKNEILKLVGRTP